MDAKNKAITEAIEAIRCAERGEPHPRLYSYRERGRQEILRRLERQQRLSQIAQPKQEKTTKGPLVLDWEQKSIGPGGAIRND